MMRHLAIVSKLMISGAGIGTFLTSTSAHAMNPCAGKGTTVVFVNGLFNSISAAGDNLREFREKTLPSLSEVKDLNYKLAWVEGKWAPLQLAEAMVQKSNDDFQQYWLWLHGLEKPPNWFDEALSRVMTDPRFLNQAALPRLGEHLELYSNAILEGKQVIVVSHSSGNFYANAALRELPEYPPAKLQPTINQRRKDNADYPKAEEMIANIQIATPVSETAQGAPWVSFKDDQVLNWIRRITQVLPGNVNAPGVSARDARGHSLSPSYLRVDESRGLIIHLIKDAYTRLRYPIPFFEEAATVEFATLAQGQGRTGFSAGFFSGSKEITSVDERSDGPGARLVQYMAQCRDLRPGSVDIRAESIKQESSDRVFEATAYVGASSSQAGKPLRMTNPKTISRWRLGQVQVSRGQGKDPVEVDVRYLPQPELIK